MVLMEGSFLYLQMLFYVDYFSFLNIPWKELGPESPHFLLHSMFIFVDRKIAISDLTNHYDLTWSLFHIIVFMFECL
mgnify:CR=1 FL=1